MKFMYITLIVLIIGVIIFYFLYHNNKRASQNPQVITQTLEPSPIDYIISKTAQQELLNSTTDYFTDSNKASAQRMKTEFLPHSVIWLILKYPGSLDRPAYPIGVQNKKLFLLSDLGKTIAFYNSDFKIPNTNDFIKLAAELLQVAYFTEEFGYANNTSKGRGYNFISNISEIAGVANKDVKFDVRPPTTTKQNNNYLTEVWFWGAHNCELHKFSLINNESKIENYKDEAVEKLGTCQPLTYE